MQGLFYKMRKLLLLVLFIITGSLVAAFFFFRGQIDLLAHTYPVWNMKQSKYELVPSRPSHWLELKDISYEARWAIVISEDWAFYQHEGLDFNQLKMAITESLVQKKLVRGASTITQQVIKNALLSSEKSIIRKLKEVILAMMIERRLSKEQLLEIYLNLVELGKDIYGIKLASYYYFQKHPSKLDAKEGAFLAMLLPSPKRYAQSFRDKKLTTFAKEQVSQILNKLEMAKVITTKQKIQYDLQPLSFEIISGYSNGEGLDNKR